MTSDDIKKLIEKAMPNSAVTVSGDGSKFETTIVSTKFAGMKTIDRHRLVYGVLADHISTGEIHALTIKAFTPEEADTETK